MTPNWTGNESNPAFTVCMGGDLRQYSVSNYIMKNLQFPFLIIRTEIEPTEENLRIESRN